MFSITVTHNALISFTVAHNASQTRVIPLCVLPDDSKSFVAISNPPVVGYRYEEVVYDVVLTHNALFSITVAHSALLSITVTHNALFSITVTHNSLFSITVEIAHLQRY